MQIQLGEPRDPCALHLAPQAESPPEPAARSSPLPSVTPFRQPRGRAAQPSGLRSANFYKPDGGWQANQGWLGKQPPCCSGPPDRKRCNKKRERGGKEMFRKPPWGLRAAIRVPSRRILARGELGSRECAAKVGTRAGSPGREMDRRPRGCARASVCRCERGVLGAACAWRYVLGIYGIQGKPQLHTG